MQTNNDGKKVRLDDGHYLFDGVVYSITAGAGVKGHQLFDLLEVSPSMDTFLQVVAEHGIVFPGTEGRVVSAVLNNGSYQYVVRFDTLDIPVPVSGQFLHEV